MSPTIARDAEDAARAAREVDVAAHVRTREPAERRPGERTQAAQRARGHLDLGRVGEADVLAAGSTKSAGTPSAP